MSFAPCQQYLESGLVQSIEEVCNNSRPLFNVLGVIRSAYLADVPYIWHKLAKSSHWAEPIAQKPSSSFTLTLRQIPVATTLSLYQTCKKLSRFAVEKRVKEVAWRKGQVLSTNASVRRREDVQKIDIDTLESIELELRILAHTTIKACEYIIDILAYSWEENSVIPMIYLEHASFGALDDFLQDPDADVSWDERYTLCTHVATALHALHESSIVHCDLKPSNIVIFPISGNKTGRYVAKVTDFGSALLLEAVPKVSSYRYRGTLAWKPPDTQFDTRKEGLKAWDIYSFGLLIWSIFARNGESCVELAFLKSKKSSFTVFWESEPVSAFLSECLEFLKTAPISDKMKSSLDKIFHMTLVGEPSRRAGALEIIRQLDGTTISNPEPKEMRLAYQGVFDFSRTQIPWPCQERLVSELTVIAEASGHLLRGQAAWEIASCYLCGFGIRPNEEKLVHNLRIAAEGGARKAIALLTGHGFMPQPQLRSELACTGRSCATYLSHDFLSWFRTSFRDDIMRFMRHEMCASLTDRYAPDDPPEIEILTFLNDLMLRKIEASPNETHFSLLQFAIILGTFDQIKTIVSGGADVNHEAGIGLRPLGQAVQMGRTDVVQLLITHGAECTPEHSTGLPLHWIFMLPCQDIFEIGKLLIEKGRPNSCEQARRDYRGPGHVLLHGTPLICCIKSGCVAGVKMLLQNGADANHIPTPFKFSPLKVATALHAPDLVDLLLQHNANPTLVGDPSIHGLVARDPDLLYERFLRHFTAETAALSTVRVYKDHGHSLEVQNPGGETVLMVSVQQPLCLGNITQMLLNFGANAETKDNEGIPALIDAVRRMGDSGPEDMGLSRVTSLLEAGANVNTTMCGGFTALHMCACYNLPATAEKLIEYHADIEARSLPDHDYDNISAFVDTVTPLLSAALLNSPETIRILLSHGADIGAPSNQLGVTAIVLALMYQWEASLEALIEGSSACLEIGDLIHLATKFGNPEFSLEDLLTEYALEADLSEALTETAEPGKFTFLLSSISYANARAVKFLLGAGADCRAKMKIKNGNPFLPRRTAKLQEIAQSGDAEALFGYVENFHNGENIVDGIQLRLPDGKYDCLQLAREIRDHPRMIPILQCGRRQYRYYQQRMDEIIEMLKLALNR